MCADGKISEIPLKNQIAAVSVGKCRGVPLLDLCYEEDSTAEVDANVVMTGRGELVELQGTGEGATFSRAELAQMLDLAELGIAEIRRRQTEVLELTEDERRLFERCA